MSNHPIPVINLGAGMSSSAYSLIEILNGKNPDGNIIYEIHEQVGPGEANPEFVNRAKEYYKAFVDSYMVDQWASNIISYVAKVDTTWFVAEHTGSNTYLGTGPTSVIAMRQHCFEKGIKILYVENSLENWLDEVLNKKKPRTSAPGTVTEIEAYQKANLIIKRCGDGIARIIGTAQKLHEPNYRDLFMAAIHSHSEFTVEVEAKNRKGFTDLKVIDRKLNCTFIYEFKIHDGKESIKEGLKQITDQYPTANNKLNGLVFINSKKCDLSELMSVIITEAESIGLIFQSDTLANPEHIATAKHKFVRDKTIECTLTIFLFDIQK